MGTTTHTALVIQLAQLVAGGNAHAPFAQAVAGPPRHRAVPGVFYASGHPVEHLRRLLGARG